MTPSSEVSVVRLTRLISTQDFDYQALSDEGRGGPRGDPSSWPRPRSTGSLQKKGQEALVLDLDHLLDFNATTPTQVSPNSKRPGMAL